MSKILEEYYKENKKNLINRIRGKAGNVIDAEDVVQETFARALKHIDNYDNRRSFEGWILGILYNALSDFRREERMHGMPGMEEPLFDLEEAHEAKDMAYQAINKAEGITKDILVLCFVKGYTPKDIADILSTSPYVVRHTLSRFTKKLKNSWHKSAETTV